MKQYEVVPTKAYKKDYKRLVKSGFDVEKLERVIDMLASGTNLEARFRDHALKGVLGNSRECHIGPDWLLRYTKNEDRLILILLSTGTHRDVLGIE